MQSLRGRLLVATPPMTDPNFDRTVVLMLEHGSDGALGLVLNRPSETSIDDALPDWETLAADPAFVFVGGPVSPDAVIALARGNAATAGEGWVDVLDGLGTVDLGREELRSAAAIDALRVFVGYAGWAPGQLESEIDVGGWFVVDSQPDDVFTSAPAQLWRAVLRRQRGRVAMFASSPDDPSDN